MHFEAISVCSDKTNIIGINSKQKNISAKWLQYTSVMNIYIYSASKEQRGSYMDNVWRAHMQACDFGSK